MTRPIRPGSTRNLCTRNAFVRALKLVQLGDVRWIQRMEFIAVEATKE